MSRRPAGSKRKARNALPGLTPPPAPAMAGARRMWRNWQTHWI